MTIWGDTPLARAVIAAIERADAVAGDDRDGLVTRSRQDRGAMLLGTGIDEAELNEYLSGLAEAYFQLMIARVDQLDGDPLIVDQLDCPELRRAFLEVFRGSMTQGVLIGHHYRGATSAGSTLADVEFYGEPTAGTSRGVPATSLLERAMRFIDDNDKEPLTHRQIAELRTDAVQAVLDLECDRMERVAPMLEVFGFPAIGALLRASALALRGILEGVGPEGGQ